MTNPTVTDADYEVLNNSTCEHDNGNYTEAAEMIARHREQAYAAGRIAGLEEAADVLDEDYTVLAAIIRSLKDTPDDR